MKKFTVNFSRFFLEFLADPFKSWIFLLIFFFLIFTSLFFLNILKFWQISRFSEPRIIEEIEHPIIKTPSKDALSGIAELLDQKEVLFKDILFFYGL